MFSEASASHSVHRLEGVFLSLVLASSGGHYGRYASYWNVLVLPMETFPVFMANKKNVSHLVLYAYMCTVRSTG